MPSTPYFTSATTFAPSEERHIRKLQPSPQPGVYDYYNQASSVHHNQPPNMKCGSFAPAPSNYNCYHSYGGSGASSNSHISKVVGKRNMQPPVANGAGYNPYGSSCHGAIENHVVNPSRKRKLSSSRHHGKIFTQKEVIKSRGRCLVELDSYYTSHYDLQDFLTSQKKPKNDKDMRLGLGAENSRHFRMPDEPIHFVRGGTFDSNDCLKFNPPPNFFYRRSKALQDLDWNFQDA